MEQPISPFFSYIVAASENHVIGCENAIPWRVPSDLRRFRKLTLGNAIIMGRRTYDSIGRPLDQRKNIVISRENEFIHPHVSVYRDWRDAKQAAVDYSRENRLQEIFVIGGQAMFELFKNDVQKIYLTRIHAHVHGDTFFHFELEGECWRELHAEYNPANGDQFSSTYFEFEKASCQKEPLRTIGAVEAA